MAYQNIQSEKLNPLKQAYQEKLQELQKLKKETQKEQSIMQINDSDYKQEKSTLINQINEKKKLLDQLKQNKEKIQKNVDDQKKMTQKDLLLDQNIEKQIQLAKEELKQEKEKYRKIEKEHQDKQFEQINQAELLADLETLYREKAKELGFIVNPTKDKDKGDEKAILFRPKPADESKDQKPEDVYSLENFYKKIFQIRSLRKQKEAQDAQIKSELEQIQFKIYNLQILRQETYGRMKALEIESNILISRVKEMQHTHTSSQNLTISSININGNYASYVKTSLDIEKKRDISQILQYTRKRGIQREFGGNIQNSESIIFFDDNSQFGDINIQKIVKLKIYHKQNKQIFGIQAVYQANGRTFKGLANVDANQFHNLEVAEISIEEDDYLKTIMGHYSDIICTIRIDTEKGKSLSVGSFSKIEKYQEFKIDVKSKNQAVCLFGALDQRQGSFSNNDYFLLCIGLEIKQLQDPIRNHVKKNSEEILEEICFTEENEDQMSQIRIERMINQRKIRYKLKNVAKSMHIQGQQTPNYTILGSQSSRLYSKYSTALTSIKQSYYASPDKGDKFKMPPIELSNSVNNLLSVKQQAQNKQQSTELANKNNNSNNQKNKDQNENTKQQPTANKKKIK